MIDRVVFVVNLYVQYNIFCCELESEDMTTESKNLPPCMADSQYSQRPGQDGSTAGDLREKAAIRAGGFL